MATQRWKAIWGSWKLAYRLKQLRREETAALEIAGKSFRSSEKKPDVPLAEPVASALARVIAHEDHERALAGRLAASLEGDRSDYRTTPSDFGRWLIVARGILDRLVVRDEAWRARRELPLRYAEAGAQAFAGAAEFLPEEDRKRVAAVRADMEKLVSERAALLAPHGGEALPNWLRATLEELREFGSFLREELTKKIFLRMPALAAMAAAWWIAHRFTSSSVEAGWSRVTGAGRQGLSTDALELLSFWLPLLVAALVAYSASVVKKRVERRYLGPPEPKASQST